MKMNEGVIRKRNCKECKVDTSQEILFENNLFVAYCLECGNETVLSKGEEND